MLHFCFYNRLVVFGSGPNVIVTQVQFVHFTRRIFEKIKMDMSSIPFFDAHECQRRLRKKMKDIIIPQRFSNKCIMIHLELNIQIFVGRGLKIAGKSFPFLLTQFNLCDRLLILLSILSFRPRAKWTKYFKDKHHQEKLYVFASME